MVVQEVNELSMAVYLRAVWLHLRGVILGPIDAGEVKITKNPELSIWGILKKLLYRVIEMSSLGVMGI